MKRVVIEYDESLCNWLVKSEGLSDDRELGDLLVSIGHQLLPFAPVWVRPQDQHYEVAK